MPRSLAPSPTTSVSMSSRSKDSVSSTRVASLGAAQNRLPHFAGELAVADEQLVGAVLLEADSCRHRIGEQRKAAGDQAGPGAIGAHGRDQLAAARRRNDALGQHLVDHADRHVLQQRDALAQRRLERDLAAHRAFGDFCDMILQPGEIGQFVDAFLADHGGIHVGEKKPLAPDGARLHHDVDRQIAARLAQAVLDRLDVLAAVEGDVDRDFVEQPLRGTRRGQRGQRAVDDGGVERGVGGIADEGGDQGHGGEFDR